MIQKFFFGGKGGLVGSKLQKFPTPIFPHVFVFKKDNTCAFCRGNYFYFFNCSVCRLIVLHKPRIIPNIKFRFYCHDY